MKKFFIAVMLMVSASAWAAGDSFGKLEYAFRDVDGADNKSGYNLQVGTKVNDNVDVDGKVQWRRTNGTGSSSTRFEVGSTLHEEHFYVRGGIGQKFVGADDYTFYSIEPGVKCKLSKDLTVTTAYMYRDTFDSSINDKNHAVRFSADYKITSNGSVTGSVGRYWGDTEYDAVNVGYKVTF